MAILPLAGPGAGVAAIPVLRQLLSCSCRCTCLWFSGALCAASRSRLPVPGVAARPVRRGLHVQVQRFPVLGVGELAGPFPVVNVTVHLVDVPLRGGLELLVCSHPDMSLFSIRSLEWSCGTKDQQSIVCNSEDVNDKCHILDNRKPTLDNGTPTFQMETDIGQWNNKIGQWKTNIGQ